MPFIPRPYWKRIGVIVLCMVSLGIATSVQAKPDVIASIKPIESLVAGVMAGTHDQPYLLVPGASSPHTYSLRPADVMALHAAKVVFWVGPMLETFLKQPLDNLPSGVRMIALYKAPGVHLLPVQVGFGPTQENNTAQMSGIGHLINHGTEINPHIWLDPQNAEAIVHEIARVLSSLNPSEAKLYKANAARLEQRLKLLDKHLSSLLKPVRKVPFMVFHDAYAYLDHRYDLRSVGALTVEPSLPPGALRIEAARQAIRHYKVRCLFREPEFVSPLIRTVTAGNRVHIGVLDPLGASLKPGPSLYFRLMNNLGSQLEACLIK